LTKQVHVSAKILIKPLITLYIFIINLGGPAQQAHVVMEIFFVIINLKKIRNRTEGQIQILGPKFVFDLLGNLTSGS